MLWAVNDSTLVKDCINWKVLGVCKRAMDTERSRARCKGQKPTQWKPLLCHDCFTCRSFQFENSLCLKVMKLKEGCALNFLVGYLSPFHCYTKYFRQLINNRNLLLTLLEAGK
jgi:hypothetical protein